MIFFGQNPLGSGGLPPGGGDKPSNIPITRGYYYTNTSGQQGWYKGVSLSSSSGFMIVVGFKEGFAGTTELCGCEANNSLIKVTCTNYSNGTITVVIDWAGKAYDLTPSGTISKQGFTKFAIYVNLDYIEESLTSKACAIYGIDKRSGQRTKLAMCEMGYPQIFSHSTEMYLTTVNDSRVGYKYSYLSPDATFYQFSVWESGSLVSNMIPTDEQQYQQPELLLMYDTVTKKKVSSDLRVIYTAD